MTAPGYEGHVGNRFWEARSSHGRKPIFANEDALWDAAVEYFKWVDDHPLWECKATQFQGAQVDMTVPKMRAMTIGGLCLFLDIGEQTLFDYGNRDGYSAIVERIKGVIYQQKLSGAAADLLNANIIARELGLRERTETEHKGNLGVTDMTNEQLDAKLQALLNASSES